MAKSRVTALAKYQAIFLSEIILKNC